MRSNGRANNVSSWRDSLSRGLSSYNTAISSKEGLEQHGSREQILYAWFWAHQWSWHSFCALKLYRSPPFLFASINTLASTHSFCPSTALWEGTGPTYTNATKLLPGFYNDLLFQVKSNLYLDLYWLIQLAVTLFVCRYRLSSDTVLYGFLVL